MKKSNSTESVSYRFSAISALLVACSQTLFWPEPGRAGPGEFTKKLVHKRTSQDEGFLTSFRASRQACRTELVLIPPVITGCIWETVEKQSPVFPPTRMLCDATAALFIAVSETPVGIRQVAAAGNRAGRPRPSAGSR